MNFKEQIIQAGTKLIIYSAHAVDEMNAEDELITTSEVRHVVIHREIIEQSRGQKRS